MNIKKIKIGKQYNNYKHNLQSYNYSIAPNFNQKVAHQDCFIKTTNPINFRGQLFLEKDELPQNSFEIFTQKFQQNYGNIPLENAIREIVSNSREINLGGSKKVYNFPKLDDYVIAHMYKETPPRRNFPIKKTPITLPRYNFGQPIASNNHDIVIMKKVNGIENSVQNSYGATRYICKNNCATTGMSTEYLYKLGLFKNFPQSSYEHLMKQIEYLAQNGKYIDFLNSNNILIDTKDKKFHIIDLLSNTQNKIIKYGQLLFPTKAKTPGVYDAINLLLAPRYQCYFMDNMSEREKTEVKNISENAIKKILMAASDKKVSRYDDLHKIIMRYHSRISKRNELNERYYNRYDECMDLYRNILNPIQQK